MQNTSNNYKRLVRQSGRTFKAKIICTFADGNKATFTDNDIMQNSLKIASATSNEGSFDVGCAVINELNFDIDNSCGRFVQTDFTNATFDVRIGLVTAQKWNGEIQIEWLKKGIYTAEEINIEEKYISITAYDYMAKFDVEYKPTETKKSLSNILTRICGTCGVANGVLQNFANFDFNVFDTEKYIKEGTTCRDMIAYIAQLACCFAYIDSNGYLKFGWYQENDRIIAEKQKLATPVIITGIRATDIEDNTYILGNEGYEVVFENNPLIQVKKNNPFSNNVFSKRLIGYEVIPFECNILSDPSIEPGDIVTVCDLKGNEYKTPITNTLFILDGKMTIACDAETINEKQRAGINPSTKILTAAKHEIQRQITAYNMISQIAANAMGYYETLEAQDDGTVIGYMHDKPLLNESLTIWKKTVDGIFISNDGGKTYSKGIDRDGNAAVKTVSAYGITVSDTSSSFTTNIVPGTFQLLINDTVALEASAKDGINIFNGSLSIYKGSNSESDKVIYLDEDGNAAYAGYLTQPNSHTRALIGNNVYGNPGFFIYQANHEGYLKEDGTIRPYCEIWTMMSESTTCFTAPKNLNLIVEDDGEINMAINGYYRWKCTSTGGTMYGKWDFSEDQLFNCNLQNKKAFILHDGTSKVASFYNNNGNPCIVSDNGKDILFCVSDGTTNWVKLKVTSNGGYLYETWYGTSGQAISSDLNKKHDIEELPKEYSSVFDKLKPVRYKYNDGQSNRFHTGFIAQEVEQAVKAAGLSDSDFAGYLKDQDGNYFLRYDEIIALLVSEVQMLKKQYADLLEIIKERS